MARRKMQEKTNQDVHGRAKPSCRSRDRDAPHCCPSPAVNIMTGRACQELSNRLEFTLRAALQRLNGSGRWSGTGKISILRWEIRAEPINAKALHTHRKRAVGHIHNVMMIGAKTLVSTIPVPWRLLSGEGSAGFVRMETRFALSRHFVNTSASGQRAAPSGRAAMRTVTRPLDGSAGQAVES